MFPLVAEAVAPPSLKMFEDQETTLMAQNVAARALKAPRQISFVRALRRLNDAHTARESFRTRQVREMQLDR
jgi:hypothetical protein